MSQHTGAHQMILEVISKDMSSDSVVRWFDRLKITKAELKSYCLALGLSGEGTKSELAYRIARS